MLLDANLKPHGFIFADASPVFGGRRKVTLENDNPVKRMPTRFT